MYTSTIDAIGLLIKNNSAVSSLVMKDDDAFEVFESVGNDVKQYLGKEFNTSDGRRVVIRNSGIIDPTSCSMSSSGVCMQILTFDKDGICNFIENYYIGAETLKDGLATYVNFEKLIIQKHSLQPVDGELLEKTEDILASDIPNIEIYPR